MKTAQQLQNIRDALVWWPTIKPEEVIPYLGSWRGDSACGVVACFGGHCTLQPSLIAQGIRADRTGAPYIVLSEDECSYDFKVADTLFGERNLFIWRGGWYGVDEGFTGTDHELVTYRLEYALAQG